MHSNCTHVSNSMNNLVLFCEYNLYTALAKSNRHFNTFLELKQKKYSLEMTHTYHKLFCIYVLSKSFS